MFPLEKFMKRISKSLLELEKLNQSIVFACNNLGENHPTLLSIISLTPDIMSSFSLYKYVDIYYLQKRDLGQENYKRE